MAYDLSIVIVTYNSAATIGDCLTSLDRNTTSGLQTEIILIDNHSTDDTLSIVHLFQKSNPNLQVIPNATNRYFAPAVNQGIRVATGQYILLLNPDTQIIADALKQLHQVFESDPDIGVTAPQLLNPDGSIQASCRRFPKHRDVIFNMTGLFKLFRYNRFFNGWKMGDFDHQSLRDVDQPQGAALFTSREVLETVGPLDESFPMFFNDVDWCYRVKQAGYRIVYVPAAQVIHHQGSSVKQVKLWMIISSHVSFFRYFEKHYDRIYQQIINLVIGLLLFCSLPVRVLWELLRKNGKT